MAERRRKPHLAVRKGVVGADHFPPDHPLHEPPAGSEEPPEEGPLEPSVDDGQPTVRLEADNGGVVAVPVPRGSLRSDWIDHITPEQVRRLPYDVRQLYWERRSGIVRRDPGEQDLTGGAFRTDHRLPYGRDPLDTRW